MTKRNLALVASLMFAVACPDDDPVTPTGATPASCATITSSFPADEAANVYYRATLAWEFTEADTTTSVVITGPSGEVSGSSAWVGNTYIWEPAAPLTPSTSYTATLSFCDGERMPETSFMTSIVGGEVNTPEIENKIYSLDIGTTSGAIFIEPPGVGPLLQTYLDDADVDILIGVTSLAGSNLGLLGALGDGANPLGQDMCKASIPFPAASFTNPYFEVGPLDLPLDVGGVTFTLLDLEINGAFAPDGSLIAGATLSGSIDTREVISFIAEGGGDDAVCDIAANLGVVCEPCTSGGDYCLTALITNITASRLESGPLVEIDQAQATANCP